MNRLLTVSAPTQPLRKYQEETEVAVLEAMEPTEAHALIVWNDEVNTFDHVIEALIEICDHSPEQAEQCAMIIHFKGKYAVKNGSFEVLRPCCEALIDRGINATIGS
jgi:ATP-dependent Clp protease adaptor protein ClpS